MTRDNRQKRVLKEYFRGDPDTVFERDDLTDDIVRTYNYNSSDVLSFGYFQTSVEDEKEFICERNMSHLNISKDCLKKVLGKALNNDRIDDGVRSEIKSCIYHQAAFCGRIFIKPKVITTWTPLSSNTMRDIVGKINEISDLGDIGDYTYVHFGIPKHSINLLEYIDGNYDSNREINESDKLNTFLSKKVDKYYIDIIKDCNKPVSSTLDQELSRIGKTRAWYNSMIRQEGKNKEKTIKENMKNSKHNEEFSNYISIMSEALDKNDFKAYEYVKEMLDEAIEDKKHEAELMKELDTNNFGVLNHIFEQELPTLFKTNKKAVKEVIKTIKEDKNLLGQFNFYHVIKEEYKGDVADAVDEQVVLEKLVKIVMEDIDLATVKASNKKLRAVMKENNIIPSNFVDAESKALYESGNIILTRKKTTSNVMPLIESYDVVCKYMQSHKNDKTDRIVDVNKMVREFEEKLKANLNESEMSFVQQITDFKSPMAEQRKEKLFNKFKNECIDKINKMLGEDSSNVELLGLKKQIEEQKFNKESIVKDIAKLLEIRDILMDD